MIIHNNQRATVKNPTSAEYKEDQINRLNQKKVRAKPKLVNAPSKKFGKKSGKRRGNNPA